MGYSVEFELLKLLELRFNFTSHFIDEHHDWGENLGNGTWTGSMGRVISKQAHLGACMLSQTMERLQVVDFTAFTFLDEVTLLSHSPREKSKAWIVVAPFGKFTLWTIILLTTAMLLLKCLQVTMKAFGKLPSWPLSLFAGLSRQTFFSSLWHVAYGAALLSVFVLNTAYGAEFYSLLTLPRYEPPIDSLKDLLPLLATGHRSLIVYRKVSKIKQYLNVSTPLINYFSPFGEGKNSRRRPLLLEHLEQLVQTLENTPNGVTLESRVTLATERYLKAMRPLHLASVSFDLDQLSWIAPKGSPLVEPFSQVIVRIRETGLYEWWFANSLAQLPRRKGLTWRLLSDDFLRSNPTTLKTGSLEATQSVRPLPLTSLRSIFYLFNCGVAASTLLIALEIIALKTFNKKL